MGCGYSTKVDHEHQAAADLPASKQTAADTEKDGTTGAPDTTRT